MGCPRDFPARRPVECAKAWHCARRLAGNAFVQHYPEQPQNRRGVRVQLLAAASASYAAEGRARISEGIFVMPDQPKQTTPLKPAMPRVPGVVTPARQAAGGSASEPNPTTRWALGIAVLFVVGALVAYIALRASRGPSRDDRFAPVGGAARGCTAQPNGTSLPLKRAIF